MAHISIHSLRVSIISFFNFRVKNGCTHFDKEFKTDIQLFIITRIRYNFFGDFKYIKILITLNFQEAIGKHKKIKVVRVLTELSYNTCRSHWLES